MTAATTSAMTTGPKSGPKSGPYAPGALGYLRMVLIAWAVLDAAILIVVVMTGGPDLDVAGAVLVVGGFTVVLGTPIGLVGSVLVHLTCRHDPRRWRHVAAAGAAGWVCVVVPFAVVGHGSGTLAGAVLGIPVGTAAAIGRAAVRP